jgi:hypothetical protein
MMQTFGDNACHPERMSRSPERSEGEGSGSTDGEILRCAQDDSQDTSQVRSREVLSPNVCA